MKPIFVFIMFISLSSCGQDDPQNENKVNTFNGRALPENVCYVVNGGTERPFTGKYWDHHQKGTYLCVACDAPLFSSETKYDSGSGWPSFYDVLTKGNVKKILDQSHGMVRTEIRCGNCDAHLGHVFNDGPNPTGLRYCINSASLNFIENGHEGQQENAQVNNKNYELATFGAGCFWCIESVYKKVKGIISITPGYMGGSNPNPTYEEVCEGNTNHVEVIKVEYNNDIKDIIQETYNNDKFKQFLEVIIPKTEYFISRIRKYIKNKITVLGVIEQLEPFSIYPQDITKEHYNQIKTIIRERIKEIKNYILDRSS